MLSTSLFPSLLSGDRRVVRRARCCTVRSGWRDAVTNALMLPRKNTVVFEELAPLLNDEQLWAYFEDTTTCEALPDSSTRFSASYRQLIYLLKLQKDDELQDLLTSKQFAAWKQFAEQYPGRGDAALNPADKFAVWAAKESLPDPVKAAAHALFNMRSDPVAKAQYNLDLFPTTWSKDLQTIQQLSEAAPSREVQFALSSSDEKAAADFMPDEWQSVLADADISYSMTFNHVTSTTAQPLQWFNMPTLARAYQSQRRGQLDTLWLDGGRSWSHFFGPGGTLDIVTTQLYIADGLQFEATLVPLTTTTISDELMEAALSAAKQGLWPLVMGSGAKGAHEFDVKSDGSSLQFRCQLPEGDLLVLAKSFLQAKEYAG